MKFIYIKCPYCKYPQFVNREVAVVNCIDCGRSFEIVDGKAKKYYDKRISNTGKNS